MRASRGTTAAAAAARTRPNPLVTNVGRQAATLLAAPAAWLRTRCATACPRRGSGDAARESRRVPACPRWRPAWPGWGSLGPYPTRPRLGRPSCRLGAPSPSALRVEGVVAA